jgi:hypothetical protein
MTILRPRSVRATAASAALLLVLVAGCAATGPAATVPGGGASPTVPADSDGGPTPIPVPGSSGAAASDPGASGSPDDPSTGGGADGNAGSGTGGKPGFADPGEPAPTLVAPGVGLTGVHQVAATKLDTALNGRDLAVRVAWWSGVEPCNVLAGVDVARDGNTFTLTVREGSGAPSDTACIEIAQYKATIVDLGELEPGTYTVTAFGDAPPVTVTID